MNETEIHGMPEGREGVWLVTPDVAARLIWEAPEEEVHNFIGHNGVMIGANWRKAQAEELIRRPDVRSALIFEPNATMRHQLVVISEEKRWAFDVGEIDERRMRS